MKTMVCEMCNSTDLLKQDGMFICQSCGCKYSPEEAKKMMIEGTVDVKGTVDIDKSKDLTNYLTLAQVAVESSNVEDSKKYTDKILEIDPKNYIAWKYKAKMEGWGSSLAHDKTKQSLIIAQKAIELAPNDEKRAVAEELLLELSMQNIALINNALNIPGAHGDYIHNLMNQWLYVIKTIPNISASAIEDQIELCKKKCKSLSAIDPAFGYYLYNKSTPYYITFSNELAPLIQKEKPDYKPEILNTTQSSSSTNSGGCYVATCVYGSYDCPQVWTLRRFRDDTLGATWYGRAFVHTYYSISPTLVKWFGKTSWFKKMWKGTLDRMVKKLEENGVENTPYTDKKW